MYSISYFRLEMCELLFLYREAKKISTLVFEFDYTRTLIPIDLFFTSFQSGFIFVIISNISNLFVPILDWLFRFVELIGLRKQQDDSLNEHNDRSFYTAFALFILSLFFFSLCGIFNCNPIQSIHYTNCVCINDVLIQI